MAAAAVTAASGGGATPPPPIHRGPLGPYPQPIVYPTTLPFTPPAGPDLYFYRGNFCGLDMPGAPVVPGCNDKNPNLMMACLLDNYPREWQEKYLQTYAGYGFTHLQRSIGHSLYYGGSVQSHSQLSKRAQQYGLWADEWFLGGEALNARDQTWEYWEPILDPISDQLLSAGAIDHACVGWQLDQYNQPGNVLIEIIAGIAKMLPSRIPLYTHWVDEALAWWKTGGEIWTDQWNPSGLNVMDRFTWWWAMRPYLTGGHHQGNTTMARTDPALYSAKMCDTLDYFAGRTDKGYMGQSLRRPGPYSYPFQLTGFEETAQDRFDGNCSELEGRTIGYLLMCTESWGEGHLSGYGNDATYPDGGRL